MRKSAAKTMLLGFGAAGAGLLAAMTPALAGGYTAPVVEPVVAAPAPVVVAGRDWTGFYAGGQLGYGEASADGLSDDASGAFGGVHAGYLHDFGNWVLGGELAYSGADISLDTPDASVDSMLLAKLKVGADMGQWLLYGTAGAGHYEASVAGTDYSDTGYFAGLGADYALNDSWTVGAEVLRHWADDFDGTGVDGDMTTLGMRASFRF